MGTTPLPGTRPGIRSQAAPPQRPPLAKRAKGRWFISCIILSLIGSVGFAIWNEFIRFQAYGIIDGRVVRVATPVTGFIASLEVADGQCVTRGQLLASIRSPELELQLSRIEDDLRMARVSMKTRLAELKARSRENALENLRSQVEYLQMVSQLHTERARLAELNSTSETFVQLGEAGGVSRLEALQNATALEGQTHRVQSLENAATRLRQGLDELPTDETVELLEADKARLESLEEQRSRLREYQLQGEIRSPVNGRVMLSHRWQGEYVESRGELFEILEEDSLQSIVYVTQSQAGNFRANDTILLSIAPHHRTLPFRVERLDDQTVPAPPNLSRYYRHQQRLVALLAKPVKSESSDTQGEDALWLGAEVRLPRWFHKISP